MENRLDLFSILLFLGASQGFILSGMLFFHRRGNLTANRILSVILLFFSFSIVLHTLVHAKIIANLELHAEIIDLLVLLINPHIYLYVKSITDPNFNSKSKEFKHAYPLIFGLLIIGILNIAAVPDGWKNLLKHAISVLVIIQALVYIFYANRLLVEFSERIKSTFSYMEKVNLNWLRYLVSGYMFLILISFFIESTGSNAHYHWNYGFLILSIFIYLIGYFGLRQPEIFSGMIPESKSKSHKYEKTGLTKEMAELYIQKLKTFIESEKPYLQSGLTINELAIKLKISSHHLSQIINQHYNQNFFDFINSQRIEKAKEMIMDSKFKNFNLSSICYDVGFNSTSAFNSAFKKHTGITPTQYKKSFTETV